MKPSEMKMLHVAPEPFLRRHFSRRFGEYETADLLMRGVDHRVDLQNLPFEDATYDFVFAFHVLEHIPDDKRAIREIRRIIKPGGIAVLPVPVVCEKTIEYPQPNPDEAYHVRPDSIISIDMQSISAGLHYTPPILFRKHTSSSSMKTAVRGQHWNVLCGLLCGGKDTLMWCPSAMCKVSGCKSPHRTFDKKSLG
jgi:SAM-dependent methyltransferase